MSRNSNLAIGRRIGLFVVVMLLIAVSDVALAQRGFRRSSGREAMSKGIIGLFQYPAIQAELNLTRDEAEMVFALREDLMSEYRAARRHDGQQGELPSPEQVAQKGNDLAERLLRVILRPKQYKRLEELWLQRQGLRAITEPSLADTLALTPEQREEVGELVKQLSGSYGTGPISDDDAKIAESITGALNKQQQETWESMLGETFDFRTLRRGR